MWELMSIGIEMQQRMIETHAQGLKLAQDMMHAAQKQAAVGQAALDMGEAVNKAGKAQVDLLDQWMGFWGGKR